MSDLDDKDVAELLTRVSAFCAGRTAVQTLVEEAFRRRVNLKFAVGHVAPHFSIVCAAMGRTPEGHVVRTEGLEGVPAQWSTATAPDAEKASRILLTLLMQLDPDPAVTAVSPAAKPRPAPKRSTRLKH